MSLNCTKLHNFGGYVAIKCRRRSALVASFEAQEKIMEAVGNEEYILKQRGRDNAKLLDVIGNFTLELLYIYYGLERRNPHWTR